MTQAPVQAVVLLDEPSLPNIPRLTTAAQGLTGLTLTLQGPGEDPTLLRLSTGRGNHCLDIRLHDAPYPGAAQMLRGLTSPSQEEATAAPAYLELTVSGLPGDARRHDALLTRLVCATLQAAPANAAMLSHGVMFHRAEVFRRTVSNEQPGALPLGVCVDLTVAQEPLEAGPDPLVTFLTHGLPRYGREDLYITAPRSMAPDALGLAALMVRTLYTQPADALATDQKVGRTTQEGLQVKREQSPIYPDVTVWKIDMRQEESP